MIFMWGSSPQLKTLDVRNQTNRSIQDFAQLLLRPNPQPWRQHLSGCFQVRYQHCISISKKFMRQCALRQQFVKKKGVTIWAYIVNFSNFSPVYSSPCYTTANNIEPNPLDFSWINNFFNFHVIFLIQISFLTISKCFKNIQSIQFQSIPCINNRIQPSRKFERQIAFQSVASCSS